MMSSDYAQFFFKSDNKEREHGSGNKHMALCIRKVVVNGERSGDR